MDKKLYIILLLFAWFGSLHISLIQAAQSSQQYKISRIYQNAVNKQRKIIAQKESRNWYLRKTITTGAVIATALLGIGTIYALLKTGTRPSTDNTKSPEPFIKITKQQLIEEISKLSKRIESGPQIGSWTWWKSCLINLTLTPVFLVAIFRSLGAISNIVTSKLFFATNINKFLERDTRLGRLGLQPDNHESQKKVLIKGSITEELEHYAKVFDKINSISSANSIHIEYHKKRITLNFNHIVTDMTSLIAFIYHLAGKWSSYPLVATEARDRAQYLIYITNKASQSLESALWSTIEKNTETVTAIINEFFNELEQVLISFTRIEHEYASIMSNTSSMANNNSRIRKSLSTRLFTPYRKRTTPIS